MSDDLQNRGAGDRTRINLEQDHEVRYWTRQLHCSETELRAAVGKVGNSAASVERLLHQSRRQTRWDRPSR